MSNHKIYDTGQDLIQGIDDYLLALRETGGQIQIPINIDWKKDDPGRTLRLSAAGKCPKQTAYTIHYPDEAETLSARALNVFIHGDILHDKERDLIRRVTVLQDEEARVVFPVDSDTLGRIEVVGHVDGVIYIRDRAYILDIKSINTRGFKEAITVGPREDYIDQVTAYMYATSIHNAILWMYNKDTSHRAAIHVEYDPDRVKAIHDRYLSIIESTPDSLPPRMYEPQWEISKGKRTGREYLPWQCGYCAFVDKCWADTGFEMVFDKGKPRWIRNNSEEGEV